VSVLVLSGHSSLVVTNILGISGEVSTSVGRRPAFAQGAEGKLEEPHGEITAKLDVLGQLYVKMN